MIMDIPDLQIHDGPPIDEQGSKAIRPYCHPDSLLSASHLDEIVCLTCAECEQDIALLPVPPRQR